MDFKDQIFQISKQIKKHKESVATEEATKMSFILPLITALGYDIYNPLEVVPEMSCDITRGSDKIDYAIIKDGEPIMLMECKHCKQNLDLHSTQLARYFVASKARFGVLTNGIEYRFYSDLGKANIMDEKPFLIIDITDLSDNDIEQLKKFHKSYYNEKEILSTANELKYITEIKSILNNEFTSPSPEFVKFITRQVYNGTIWQCVIDRFAPLVKKSISSIINDIISDRLEQCDEEQ
ncbi:MAG: type I restriction endonuclease [Alistipes indistinctus]